LERVYWRDEEGGSSKVIKVTKVLKVRNEVES
jgi:hypothetical protein